MSPADLPEVRHLGVWDYLDQYQALHHTKPSPPARARFVRWLIVHLTKEGRRYAATHSDEQMQVEAPESFDRSVE